MSRVVLAALVAVAGLAAGPAGADPDASATLSTTKPGARPVVVTIRFQTLLRCGRPAGVARVSFPAAATVPSSIGRTDVLVDGRASGGVRVSRHEIDVTLAAPAGGSVTCNSLVLGEATITFTTAARIGNPSSPGTYSLAVRHGTDSYTLPVTISGAAGGLYGTVMRGPITPQCVPQKPCDGPAGGVAIEFVRGSVVRARVTSADDGSYRVALAPGRYALRGPKRLETRTATVTRGRWTRLTIRIDTGIR